MLQLHFLLLLLVSDHTPAGTCACALTPGVYVSGVWQKI
jgi:hypothetical protein